MNRRDLLKGAAAWAASAAVSRLPGAETLGSDPVVRYLESLARPDGGYAFGDQAASHLTPTFSVIGSYRALGLPVPRKDRVAQFVRDHHPAQLKKLEQERRGFEYQQVQSLVWLGEDASGFAPKVKGWQQPLPYLKQYQQQGYPVFQSELGAITCRALLGLPLDDLAAHFVPYLDSRRRANGSFNNTPASDGGDGHIMNTWWGVQALKVLGRVEEKKAEVIAWVQDCQRPDGGFTHQPKPEFSGVSDAVYTWAAVRTLKELGAAPRQKEECIRYLQSLQTSEGGFASKAGWLANPLATYQSLEALSDLSSSRPSRPARARPATTLPADLKIFTAQVEAHGQGSPTDAVELARSLRIHLWGAKNAQPGWISKAQELADRDRVPVKFFVADEEYGTWVQVSGLGAYSHTSDIMAPAGSEFGASLGKAGVVSWPEFRARRLAPLRKAGGHLVWQFGENEELVRLYLDDSVERGGYAAISTFHFGNPDFTNTEPFLNCYRGQIPFIGLQDAHGAEPWWFADMTTGFRTLFLAREAGWEGWLNALQRNWVAAVRHDAVSGFKTWMHGGSDEVIARMQQEELSWRWWDNPGIRRPLVSVAAVRPEDRFEAGRPEQGITVRVRCAWENTGQGIARKPLAELVRFSFDDQVVPTELKQKKQGVGFADYFQQYNIPNPSTGRHRATAVVRELSSGNEETRWIDFTV